MLRRWDADTCLGVVTALSSLPLVACVVIAVAPHGEIVNLLAISKGKVDQDRLTFLLISF